MRSTRRPHRLTRRCKCRIGLFVGFDALRIVAWGVQVFHYLLPMLKLLLELEQVRFFCRLDFRLGLDRRLLRRRRPDRSPVNRAARDNQPLPRLTMRRG